MKSIEPKIDDPHYKNLDRSPTYCRNLLLRSQLDRKRFKVEWTAEELVDLIYLKTRIRRKMAQEGETSGLCGNESDQT